MFLIDASLHRDDVRRCYAGAKVNFDMGKFVRI